MSELKAYKGDVYIPVYGSIADADVYLKKDADEVIAELKQKLEDAKATAYTESVDMGMENRKLKRALWLARARSAHNAAMMWEVLSDEYLIGALFTIDFRCIGDPDVTEFQMFRTCIDWMKIYENAERKCRAKAEEYK